MADGPLIIDDNGFPIQPAHPHAVISATAEYALSAGIVAVAVLVVGVAMLAGRPTRQAMTATAEPGTMP